MRKNSLGQSVIAFLVVIGIFTFIGAIGDANKLKCMHSGSDNELVSGSSYCYLNKPYSSSKLSHGSSFYGSKFTNGSSQTGSGSTSSSNSSGYNNESKKTNNSSYGSSTKQNNITNKSTYDSYDDGYDDIYMDGDYADGVDDAMDEYGEDWYIGGYVLWMRCI